MNRTFFLRHFDKMVAYAIIIVFGGASAYGAGVKIMSATDQPAAAASYQPAALVVPGPRRDCPCNPCNCADCQQGGCTAAGK